MSHVMPIGAEQKPSGPRAGVTLVELLVVLGLMGAILAIALPRTTAARRQLTLDAAVHQLHGDLSRARVEAVKRNTQVVVAKTSSSTYGVQFVATRMLPEGVTFGLTSPDTVRFMAFGPSPNGAQSYTLFYQGHSRTVRVSSSGMVTAQ